MKGNLKGWNLQEIIFDDITTGASQDIKVATATARSMVTKFGFSDVLGLVNYDDSSDEEVFLGRDLGHARPYGEDIAGKIDSEVKAIIDSCYSKAKALVNENISILHKCAELLLEREKITREEFETLFGILPEQKVDSFTDNSGEIVQPGM